MTLELENPYKTLGIERTADERSVKKAYVALIRKFTPEANPEDFKRIRAAYELLSDADARARFDEGEKGYAEYDVELARRLADADDAEQKQNPELAREILRELVGKFPDATVAREKLGFAYLEAEKFEDALAEFEALAQKEPENARHFLHCAFAHGRLERLPKAEKCLLEANRLDPKDVRIALSLARFYSANQRAESAIAVIDATVARLEPGTPAILGLLLRKVEAYAVIGHAASAERTIGEVRQFAEASSDPEVFSFITSELASIAAKLFAQAKPEAANEMLAQCKSLRSAAVIECPLPTVASSTFETLPTNFREWLGSVAADATSELTLRESAWLRPLAALVASACLVGVAITATTSPSTSFGVGSWVGTFAFTLVAFGGLAASLMWIARILRSPLRSFTTLHPLYLVRATPLRVRFYPLFNLTDSRGIHQHTNGAYTGTTLTFTFGEGKSREIVSLTIRGKERAQQWLNTLLGIRGRSLELLAEGCLEAEHLVEDLPPAKLAVLEPPARSRWYLKPLVVAAGLALVATPLIARESTAAGDDEALSEATSSGSVAGLRAFVAAHPHSRHAALANQALRGAFDRTVAQLRLDPSDPGEAALTRAVIHLRDHGGMIRFWSNVEGQAFGKTAEAERAMNVHLDRALDVAGLRGLVVGSRDASDGARIVVNLRPGAFRSLSAEKGSLLTPRAGVTAFGAEVDVAIEVPGQPRFERHVVLPPMERFFADPTAPGSTTENDALLERSLDAAVHALGLHGPKAHIIDVPSDFPALDLGDLPGVTGTFVGGIVSGAARSDAGTRRKVYGASKDAGASR